VPVVPPRPIRSAIASCSTDGTAVPSSATTSSNGPRSAAGTTSRMFGGNVELATGDLADPRSVRAALDGADALFLSCADDPRRVSWETSAIACFARDHAHLFAPAAAIH
jgi:hypothetical protein